MNSYPEPYPFYAYDSPFDLSTITPATKLVSGGTGTGLLDVFLGGNDVPGAPSWSASETATTDDDATMTLEVQWVPDNDDPVTDPAPGGTIYWTRSISCSLSLFNGATGFVEGYVDSFHYSVSTDTGGVYSTSTDTTSSTTTIAQGVGYASKSFSLRFNNNSTVSGVTSAATTELLLSVNVAVP